jgi:hypothetical protein
MQEQLREEHESLWWLAAAPIIWAAHLLLSYCTAAIFCQKLVERGGPLGAARLAIAGYSVVAVLALIALGVRGYRRHRYGDTTGTRHLDTPEDRHRFLGFATVLLAGIAAVAVIYQALPAIFIGSCR